MSKRATLRDIANHAGVSLTTVSQALNHKGAISEGTRSKVVAAAEHIGYQQRVLLAPSLKARLSKLTMLTKRDPDEKTSNPFHFYVMKGIEDQCRRLGLELRFSSIAVDENSRVLELPTQASLRHTDGVLVVGAVVRDGKAFLEQLGGRPVVFINGYLYGASYDRVCIDNRSGAYDAAVYLLEQGHTQIGFVGGGEEAHPSINERREGYTKALEDAGLSAAPNIDSFVLTPDYAAQATKELLKAYPQTTALVGASDNVAIGIYRAAESLGLNVPRDLSVVGFDNLHGVKHLTPPLTTMHVDKEYLGATAVRHLYDSSAQPNRPNMTTLIRPNLIVRHSVLPPRKRTKGEP